MRKIVCLATSPWYPIPTRKQQVMSRIPDAEILYFDPSVTYLAPLKDKAARPGLSNYKRGEEENLCKNSGDKKRKQQQCYCTEYNTISLYVQGRRMSGNGEFLFPYCTVL